MSNRAVGVVQEVALCLCIVGVCLASYSIFSLSARGAHWLNPIAMRITTRIIGLPLAAVAVQFMLDGLKSADLLNIFQTGARVPTRLALRGDGLLIVDRQSGH